MVEIFPLQIDLRPPESGAQPFGEIKRARPADIVGQIIAQFGGEGRIGLGLGVSLFDGKNQRHQGFGDIASAIDTEMPALVGTGAEGVSILHKSA